MVTGIEPIDLEPLSAILDKYRNRKREALLPLLHEAQEIYGWLPREVQMAIGETLRVPLAEIHGVIEFYSLLYNEPTSKNIVRICEDSACFLAGAPEVTRALETTLAGAAANGEGDHLGLVELERVPCLGMCELAPAALIGDRPAGNLAAGEPESILSESYPQTQGKVFGSPRHITSRIGVVNPNSLDDYEKNGGLRGLRKALDFEPEELIDLMDESGIVGRGGAMFPLGRKWRFTRSTPGEPEKKHIVVNADESEPGTFKDRPLLEEDPFAVVESIIAAGYAVGAENGWIFVRGEYPKAYRRVCNAVEQFRQAGYLGQNVLGKTGFNFDIEMRLGAGAYICGEETALFEAIEGKRGFPRIKPPFPVTHGLFRQPTAVNNVETLAAALTVLNIGVDEWRQSGTDSSPGTKLFCLSGHVAEPGLYELPFGVTIRQVIEMGGGVPGDKAIQAVLVGGAAGTFIGPEKLDMALSYEEAREANIPLGSGVIMVFDETADLRETLFQLGRFFAHESCGKCFPCQLGTQRQKEILDRLAHNGGARPSDLRDLEDLGFAMTETSLCGLGQTAASAVLSAINLWPDLVE